MIQIDENELVTTFASESALLDELKSKCAGLKIGGGKDKAGLAAVHAARAEIKKCRAHIAKTRRVEKAVLIDAGRRLDAVAITLVENLDDLDAPLAAQEEPILAAKAKARAEKKEARRAKLRDRMERLAEIGSSVLSCDVDGLNSRAFEALIVEEINKHEAEGDQ